MLNGWKRCCRKRFGTIGTIFWCIQLVPQVIHNWRRKDCTGLPPLMMFLWSVCGVPFSVYFICKDANIPIQVQPQLFTFFAGLCWAQSLYYPPRDWGLKKTTLVLIGTFIVFAGAECALIFPLRKIYQERGIEWPITLMGVLAAVLLAAGLIPPYLELWKRNGQVVGSTLSSWPLIRWVQRSPSSHLLLKETDPTLTSSAVLSMLWFFFWNLVSLHPISSG